MSIIQMKTERLSLKINMEDGDEFYFRCQLYIPEEEYPIGHIVTWGYDTEDLHNLSPYQIGYSCAERFRENGYIAEALTAIIHLIPKKYRRLKIHNDNWRSSSIAHKCGFTLVSQGPVYQIWEYLK